METCFATAREAGYRSCYLEPFSRMVRACRLYEELGARGFDAASVRIDLANVSAGWIEDPVGLKLLGAKVLIRVARDSNRNRATLACPS